MNTNPLALRLVAAILIGGLAGITAPALAGLPPEIDGQALPSLAPMLEHVTPAVVNISSRARVNVRDPFFNDPIFSRFFGVPNQPRTRIEQSLGSGVIVDAKQGYVLTNNHVVQAADDIAVTLTDGKTVKAQVLGTDAETDLAVLKIPADNLTALPLADSSTLRVGDFVVAVGDPFGLGQTVTSGIVSALKRSGLGRNPGQDYQDFIQTDAAINPGNSGGALVNLRGELVGINSMIYSPSGASVGIGFAIPSTLAMTVMRQLVAHGEVQRGALGVEAQDATPQLARMLALSDPHGAVVTRVQRESAAQAAGIKPGDVIVTLDGKPVRSARDLHNLEGVTRTGTPVEVDVMRDGKRVAVRATLTANASRHAEGATYDARLAGADLAERSPGSNPQLSGVAILRLATDSRAFANGLRTGDLIVAVNRHDISGLDEFRQFLQQSPQQAMLTVIRGQNAYLVPLQ